MPKFFEKMIGLQTQKQQQKVLSYRSIVVDIASGGEPGGSDGGQARHHLATEENSTSGLVIASIRRSFVSEGVEVVAVVQSTAGFCVHGGAEAKEFALQESGKAHALRMLLGFFGSDLRSHAAECILVGHEEVKQFLCLNFGTACAEFAGSRP